MQGGLVVRKLHPAVVVAACTFVVLLVAAGIRSVPGVLIVPLETEFGWSRATVGFAVAVNIALYGLCGPFAAAVFERWGVRRTVGTALAFISLGVALTPFMTQSWHLVALWGVVVGGGSGVVALVLATTIASRWFATRRGLVVGILTASTATGQLIFLPFLAYLAEQVGWRWVSVAIACVAAVMILPVMRFMRDRPSDLGIPPYGGTAVAPRVAPTVNPAARAMLALRTGLGSRDFWLLGGSFFVCGASTNGLIGTHLIPACIDNGIPEVMAASLLAAMGVFDLVGTTLSGWLSDRWDNRVLLAWYYGFRGLSLLFLPFAFELDPGLSMAGLGVFAVFYGLDWIATVPPTVRLTAGAFGEENAPVMFAWIAAMHQLGAAAAAWSAGLVRVETGSYVAAFWAAGALCLVASVMVAFIGTGSGSRRVREAAAAV
ncbi:MAG: MFS transporter [Gemmatimonadaceae bacterium]|nr:MFS transporter [Acetobacteraceae bacterium]